MVIRVVIDIREEDLWKALEAWHTEYEGWYVEKAPLDVGDICFYEDKEDNKTPLVAIERKTAEDFGASLKDGRYREQRARLYALRGMKTAIAYLLEIPPWSPNLTRTWCRGTFTEVQLQHAMARLQLRHTIPLFQTTTLKESVQWIRRIAKALVADPTCFACGMATTCAEAATVYTDAIHVKKASNQSPERIFLSMILSIPGLGKNAADALAKHTDSSFLKLQTYTEKELSDIQAGKRKLGKKIANAVFTAIHR